MSKQGPIVIQFNSIDDFITEVALVEAPVARAWLATWGSGGNPGIRHQGVVVQAIDPAQGAVLTVSLMLGSYEVLNGQAFGPTAERCATVIREFQEEALEKVKSYLVQQLPDLPIRGGSINTGLDGPSITRAGWDGFEQIYDELRLARNGGH